MYMIQKCGIRKEFKEEKKEGRIREICIYTTRIGREKCIPINNKK